MVAEVAEEQERVQQEEQEQMAAMLDQEVVVVQKQILPPPLAQEAPEAMQPTFIFSLPPPPTQVCLVVKEVEVVEEEAPLRPEVLEVLVEAEHLELQFLKQEWETVQVVQVEVVVVARLVIVAAVTPAAPEGLVALAVTEVEQQDFV